MLRGRDLDEIERSFDGAVGIVACAALFIGDSAQLQEVLDERVVPDS
jgi:hypothetical protein